MRLPSDEQLKELAGTAAFKRAHAYVRSGAVEITVLQETHVEAVVSGTDDYDVTLNLAEDAEHSMCTCPAFGEGAFCKHLVATAMVARNSAHESAEIHDNPAPTSSEAPSSDESPDSDLRSFLGKQSAARLAGWLADLADSDSAIEKRLRVYQAQSDPRALRAALGKLLRAPRFLDWRRSRAFARELDPVVNILSDIAATESCQWRRAVRVRLDAPGESCCPLVCGIRCCAIAWKPSPKCVATSTGSSRDSHVT